MQLTPNEAEQQRHQRNTCKPEMRRALLCSIRGPVFPVERCIARSLVRT